VKQVALRKKSKFCVATLFYFVKPLEVRSFVGRTNFFFFCHIKDAIMYSSAQATSFVAPDASFLPAMAKRTASEASEATVVEFPVTALEEYDSQLFEVKVRGKKKDGTVAIAPAYNGKRLTLNLKKWTEVKYRIRPYDYTVESVAEFQALKVTLVADNDICSTINSVEEAVKKVVLEQHANCKWHSSLQEDLFSAKLVVEAKDPTQLTQCRVRPFQKDVVVAAGKAQVEPLLNEYSEWARSRAKVAVTLHNVWIMRDGAGFKAGATWRIVNIMVDLPEKIRHVFPDVFANASWDDDE
jgi:hypothetical protein